MDSSADNVLALMICQKCKSVAANDPSKMTSLALMSGVFFFHSKNAYVPNIVFKMFNVLYLKYHDW